MSKAKARNWSDSGINPETGCTLNRHRLAEDHELRAIFLERIHSRIGRGGKKQQLLFSDKIVDKDNDSKRTPDCLTIGPAPGNYVRGKGSKGGSVVRKSQYSEKYVRIEVRHKGIDYVEQAHVVLLVQKHVEKQDPENYPVVWDDKWVVSHDCHYKACGNPDHLSLVLRSVNTGKSRINCFNGIVCTECGNGFSFCRCVEKYSGMGNVQRCIPVVKGICFKCEEKIKTCLVTPSPQRKKHRTI